MKQAQLKPKIKKPEFSENLQTNRIYTTAEAANILGCSKKAVVKLIKDKQLRGKMPGNGYRITGRAILDFMGDPP